jgi:hypothetical protein
MLAGRCRRLRWRGDVEERTATLQAGSPPAVGEEAEVADADQPLGQNVDEEASQELIGAEGHNLLLAARGVVRPTEGDSILLERNEAMVGDSDAVGITSQVVENMLRSPEGWLGIDDPLLGKQLMQELAESLGLL